MSLDFVAEVWDTIRSHVEPNDRKDAADDLVNLLIDHNYEPSDIKEAFRSDKDISKALKYYAEQHDTTEEEDEDDEYMEDDYAADDW